MDHSPFSKLPAELRNNIYELAIREPEAVAISVQNWYIGERAFQARPIGCGARGLALTMTCQKIRNETTAMYYNINSFSITLEFEMAFAQTSLERPLEVQRRAALAEFDLQISVIRLWFDMIGLRSRRALTSVTFNVGDSWRKFDAVHWARLFTFFDELAPTSLNARLRYPIRDGIFANVPCAIHPFPGGHSAMYKRFKAREMDRAGVRLQVYIPRPARLEQMYHDLRENMNGNSAMHKVIIAEEMDRTGVALPGQILLRARLEQPYDGLREDTRGEKSL